MGTHDFTQDPRNAEILIDINGSHFSRNDAKISVFDSGFILGDGVWEGMRLHSGHLVFQDLHMDRLFEGAKAIDIDIGLSKPDLLARIYALLDAGGMHSDVHIRLMVTRGLKRTPYQHPNANVGPATIVIIPEYKIASEATARKGLKLFTVHVRRGYPDVQDPKLNSHSKLNCITACIQADKAGADEGLMLDPHGFVATCNSTHFFIVRRGEVWTSTGDFCLAGITRSNIIRLCRENHIPVYEKNFSLTEVYGADEAFVTGTFGGLTPAIDIDGRTVGSGAPGPMTEKLRQLFKDLIARECKRHEP